MLLPFATLRLGRPLRTPLAIRLPQNLNQHRYSGLANARTLHIAPQASGNGVTLIERDPKASPFAQASAYKSKNVKGKGGRKVAGAVSRQSGGEGGRLDLRTVSFSV